MTLIRLYWIGKEFYTTLYASFSETTLETGSKLKGTKNGDLRKF
ncbi:hypothetical protein [Leptospira interrogans]|nr:hypothetical protein [Leptospira interrogans]